MTIFFAWQVGPVPDLPSALLEPGCPLGRAVSASHVITADIRRIGILAGAFNPVTRAHLALAEAAAKTLDEVVFVVPHTYPHKELHGAATEDRIEMLKVVGGRVETARSGLFIDIARELRQPDMELFFICGKDAAQRVVDWDYGEPGAIEKMLEEFSLLVAERGETYQPPAHLGHRVHHLKLDEDFSDVSSTEVRRRIAAGEPWEHLVPSAIAARVRKLYAG